MESVKLPLPLNISEAEKPLFTPYSCYIKPKQKIKNFKNVFVAFSGFCMNNKGLIKQCHHDFPTQLHDYQNDVAQYYYDAVDHPENLIILDDENKYLTIHHPWFNYYHWICESIFRLWMVRSKLDSMTLVLPQYYGDADFIMGSLEPFHIKNIFFIPNGKSLMVKHLCLPQIKPLCDSYNAGHVRQIRDFYINYVAQKTQIQVKPISRLYISRKLAGRRAIVNEDEVLRIIEKYNFEIFYPEKHTFLEQVAIFSQVKYLVGTHGSGLTNMLFMESKTSLLELHKNETNELDHPSPLFWYLAHALRIKYYHQSCETFGEKDYFKGDYIIDTDLLEQNLIKMLAG